MKRKKFLVCLFSLFLILVFVSSLNAFKVRYTWYAGKKYVYLDDVATYYGMKMLVHKTYCELMSRYSKIKLPYRTKKVNLNGTNVYLSLPIIYNKKNLEISEVDFFSLLDPVLRMSSLKRHRLKTIVIDPGHGGRDTGARGKYSKERDIVLQIALRLKSILEKNGFKVYLTRNSNSEFIPLKLRPTLCRKCGGDLFISIHCNATAGSSRIAGVETFSCTPIGTRSTSGGSIARVKQNGNFYDKNNVRLGYEIQKYIIHSGHKKVDRGLKHAQFAVLKYCSVPAVLVETGFITNPREEYLLRQSGYQTEIALSIAKGIVAYRNAMVKGKG